MIVHMRVATALMSCLLACTARTDVRSADSHPVPVEGAPGDHRSATITAGDRSAPPCTSNLDCPQACVESACVPFRNTGESCDEAADCTLTALDCVAGSCEIIPICGNDAVESGEDCDDGNQVADDGCTATCQWELHFQRPRMLHGTEQEKEVSLCSGGAGIWLSAWSSDAVLQDSTSVDCEIAFSRSMDSGTTWSAPTPLNSNASTDTGCDSKPQIDSDGFLSVVVWSSLDDFEGMYGSDSDIFLAVSTDLGISWTAPVAVNSNAAADMNDDSTPTVSIGTDGALMVAWMSDGDLSASLDQDMDILFAISNDSGASWTAPAALNGYADSDSGHDMRPQLAWSGVSGWLAVWGSGEDVGGTMGLDSDVLSARWNSTTKTWSQAVAVNVDASDDLGGDACPSIAQGDDGLRMAAWHSQPDPGGFAVNTTDIVIATSNDSGTTWSPPVMIQNNVAGTVVVAQCPKVATTGAGNWVVVWDYFNPLGGAFGNMREILVASSNNNGATWSAPAALGTGTIGDDFFAIAPALAADRSGSWAAAWRVTARAWEADILAVTSSDAGLSWSVPVALDGTTGFDLGGVSKEISLGSNRSGTWIATWHSQANTGGSLGDDNDIFTAVSTDHGATWTLPAPIHAYAASDVAVDLEPDMAVSADGHAVVVWRSSLGINGVGGNVLASVSENAGALWSAPIVLNPGAPIDAGYERSIDVTMTDGGHVVAVWTSTDDLGGTVGSDEDIIVTSSIDFGSTWAVPKPLNSQAAGDSGNDRFPRVAVDAGGTWVAVWASEDPVLGTIGTDSDILVARSTDHGITWTTAIALNSHAASDTFSDTAPTVATNRRGTWMVAWESAHNLANAVGVDVDLLVSVSTNQGSTWTPPSVLNGNAATDSSEDRFVDIATDEMGSWIAVWSSRDNLRGLAGDDHDIVMALSQNDGATWSFPELLVDEAQSDVAHAENYPRIESDRNGHWVVGWQRHNSVLTAGSIYF